MKMRRVFLVFSIFLTLLHCNLRNVFAQNVTIYTSEYYNAGTTFEVQSETPIVISNNPALEQIKFLPVKIGPTDHRDQDQFIGFTGDIPHTGTVSSIDANTSFYCTMTNSDGDVYATIYTASTDLPVTNVSANNQELLSIASSD